MVAVYRTIGVPSATVIARPAVPGYDLDAGKALATVPMRTDLTGRYTFNAPPNNRVNPAGVYWTITEPGNQEITVLVPGSDVPAPPGGWLVDDIRVVGPDDPESVIVGVNPDTYAQDLAATDAALAARLVAASNLADVASKPTARTNLGLGSAATHPATDFDTSGAAATAQAAAIAAAHTDAASQVAAEQARADAAYAVVTEPVALTKLAKASNLSDLASVSTARANLGLGTAATQPSSAFDAAGVAAAAVAAEQTRAESVYVAQKTVQISAKEYAGVLGDGSDQTTALAAMATDIATRAAAANGQGIHLVFPPGDYKTDPLTIQADNIHISAYGATLTSSNHAGSTVPALQVFSNGTGHVIVEGLHIRHTTPCAPLTDVKSTFAHGLDVRGGADATHPGTFIRVKDVQVEGAWDHGIQCRYAVGVRVEGCHVDGALATGIYIYDVEDISVDNNRVANTRDDNMFLSADVSFGKPIYRASVTNNKLSYSQEKGVGCSGVLQATFTGNQIFNTYAMGLGVLQDSAFGLGPSEMVTVVGNTIRNAGQYYNNGGSPKHTTVSNVATGIYVSSAADRVIVLGNDVDNSAKNGISVVGATGAASVYDVTVGKNVITTSGGSGISVGSGADTGSTNVQRFSLLGNEIHDAQSHGIVVQQARTGLIAGNNISTWGQSGTGTQYGITVSTAINVDVNGNLLLNDTVAGGTPKRINDLTAGSNTNVRAWGNRRIAASGDDISGDVFEIGSTHFTIGTVAPTAGTWSVGDFCFNSNPTTSAALLGWRCISAGTPGTWVSIASQATLGGAAVPQRTVAGSYISASGTGSSTAAPANGRLFLTPIAINASVTAVTLNVRTTANGDAGSTIRLGLYADDGTTNPTGAPLAEGTVAGDGGAATKTLTISKALTPGVYWTAAVVQGVTVTSPTVNVYASRLPGLPCDANPVTNVNALYKDAVTGALPTSPTGLGVQTSAPIVTVGI